MTAWRILVVDDDPNMLLLIEYNLGRRGYEVVTATDGHMALKKAQEDHFDLVILDAMLPGLSGFEICKRLRSQERFARTPILLLTARSSIEDFEEAAAVGTTDYITKPFDPVLLADQVASYLTSPAERGL